MTCLLDDERVRLYCKVLKRGFTLRLAFAAAVLVNGQLKLMSFDQQELWEQANEPPTWHERLESEVAVQSRVHEIGNLEAAVSLLLSTSPESSYFYVNALLVVALSSAISTSLLELVVKGIDRVRSSWCTTRGISSTTAGARLDIATMFVLIFREIHAELLF
ncbi:hypothetical protein OROMI_002597 [Orobanche minor]